MNELNSVPFHQLSSETIVRSLMAATIDRSPHQPSTTHRSPAQRQTDSRRHIKHLKLSKIQRRLFKLLLLLSNNRNKETAIITASQLGALSLEFAYKRFELERNARLTRKCQKLVRRDYFKPTKSVAAMKRNILYAHKRLAEILVQGGTPTLEFISQKIKNSDLMLRKTGHRKYERWTGHYRSSSRDLVAYFSKIQDLLSRE